MTHSSSFQWLCVRWSVKCAFFLRAFFPKERYAVSSSEDLLKRKHVGSDASRKLYGCDL